VPAIKGAVHIYIYITFSQPDPTELYNENIGGHRYTFTTSKWRTGKVAKRPRPQPFPPGNLCIVQRRSRRRYVSTRNFSIASRSRSASYNSPYITYEHLYSPQVVAKKNKNTNKQFKQTNKHNAAYLIHQRVTDRQTDKSSCPGQLNAGELSRIEHTQDLNCKGSNT